MTKVETLRGSEITRLPVVVAHAVTRFAEIEEIEVWKTGAPSGEHFEYRLFRANCKRPCVRICLSE